MDQGQLRLVVIGCGRVFERYHLPAIGGCEQVQLVGVCEMEEVRRAWISNQLPSARCEPDVEQLLHSVEADAALVCTPPQTHAAIVERLLAAGLHVLVEKPMALTLDEARRLQHARQTSGKVLRVGFNRRYRRDYMALRQAAANIMRQITFTFIAETGRWQSGDKSITPDFVLHDAGSHALDLVAHVCGQPIERLQARVENEADGLIVRMAVQLAGDITAICIVGHSARYVESLVVSDAARTRQATASANAWNKLKLAACKLTGRLTATDESFRAQLVGFADACRGRDDGRGANVIDGLASVAAIEAAIASIRHNGAWREIRPTSPAKMCTS
ncbi:MAG: Gfo/Idh/MocA family oxidoreductase [Phycisphaeraceae bacterium]|nr:Gfo/Idh/MocA family oxidoreductase [Phycisphaeraceae bacterium]